MSPLQLVYLILAALGLSTTMYFNVAYFQETGTFNVLDLMRHLYASNAGSSIVNDLLVAYAAFLCWLFAESRRLDMGGAWIFMVLSFVAFAFAFPLYLFYRERFIQQRAAAPA